MHPLTLSWTPEQARTVLTQLLSKLETQRDLPLLWPLLATLEPQDPLWLQFFRRNVPQLDQLEGFLQQHPLTLPAFGAATLMELCVETSNTNTPNSLRWLSKHYDVRSLWTDPQTQDSLRYWLALLFREERKAWFKRLLAYGLSPHHVMALPAAILDHALPTSAPVCFWACYLSGTATDVLLQPMTAESMLEYSTARDERQNTILHWAAVGGQATVLRLMKQVPQELLTATNRDGNTFWHFFCQCFDANNLAARADVLEACLDSTLTLPWNLPNHQGQTPLDLFRVKFRGWQSVNERFSTFLGRAQAQAEAQLLSEEVTAITATSGRPRL